MIKSVFIVFLVEVALCASPVDFRTPLTIGAYGDIHSYVVSSTHANVTLQARLYVESSSKLYNPHKRRGPAQVSFAMVDNASHVYFAEIADPGFTASMGTNSLGIAHESDIVQQSGAVAVIRQNATAGELIIGSTREYFTDNCQPDTLVTLNATSTGFFDVEINFVTANSSMTFGSHLADMDDTYPYRAHHLPPALFDEMKKLLHSFGVVFDGLNRFSRCRESVSESLPSIEFRLASGSLVLHPHDYLVFKSDTDTCYFLLGIGFQGSLPSIDPLMLVGKNVRVTSSNMWDICASLEQTV